MQAHSVLCCVHAFIGTATRNSNVPGYDKLSLSALIATSVGQGWTSELSAPFLARSNAQNTHCPKSDAQDIKGLY